MNKPISRYGNDPSTSAVYAHDHLRDAVWCAQNKAENLIEAGAGKNEAIVAGVAFAASLPLYADLPADEINRALRSDSFRLYIRGWL